MSMADFEPDPPPSSPLFKLAMAVVVVVALAALVRSIFLPAPHGPSAVAGLIGQPAPPIKAAGWLNGEAPAEDAFRDKVVVVDAWAHWCPPCFEASPELIALYKKYSPRGAVFVGLTSEGAGDIRHSKVFLEKAGITWLNGYGAIETLIALNADSIPQVWVIDRTGTIVWDQSSSESIETALDRALDER
jgi:thiol-disulfide isomerase/thioredoxin